VIVEYLKKQNQSKTKSADSQSTCEQDQVEKYPTSATNTGPESQYRGKWVYAFERANRPAPQLTEIPIADRIHPYYDLLEHHRLDRFIWPEVQYRPVAPAMMSNDSYSDEGKWITLNTETEVKEFLKKKFNTERLMVMHDDAGMGKTAFSWKLFELMLSTNPNDPFVIRIEGIWPRSKDDETKPLSLMDAVIEEILGYRILGETVNQAENFSGDPDNARTLIKERLAKKSVIIFLDGFDQMTPADRNVAEIEIKNTFNNKSEIRNSRWLVSGRSFSFRTNTSTKNIFSEKALRIRLRRFNQKRQNDYFADLAEHPFFKTKDKNPLDYMCSNWRTEASDDDLGVPLHLSEIRRVIEDFLQSLSINQATKNLEPIYSSSDLHARVSTVYLRRAVEHFDATHGNSGATGPNTAAAKIDALRYLCGCLAIQMMLDENYNASIDNTTYLLESYNGIERGDLVETYLKRSRHRYENSLQGGKNYWQWGVNVLQSIEIAHRGDIDIFTHECRSFRDRKAMEWYAAHYLVNHSDSKDWNGVVPHAGNSNINRFLGADNWTRCWKLAMEMPKEFYIPAKLRASIGYVFARTEKATMPRPCEWMWIAWNSRLEQDDAAKTRNVKQLQQWTEVIEAFRNEFRTFLDDNDSRAIKLKYDPSRDQPNTELSEPNQTTDGWYRRIPPNGDTSKFRGERPDDVTVSFFWLRKYVVTMQEYQLFDPFHKPNLSKEHLPANADWYSATMFCKWLGDGYRLPTEAEWETACRAGSETQYCYGDSDEKLGDYAWFGGLGNSVNDMQPVGCLAPNDWGLYDMHGNVWEWCSDWYDEYPKDAVSDPFGPREGSYRVFRGGSWNSEAADCRSAFRNGYSPVYRSGSIGFRLALSSSGVPK
jgi:hypothetical protein